MEKKINREARDKIIRARTGLLISNGFFGYLAMHLKLVEIDDDEIMPTMGVDGFNIFYNPRFTLRLTEPECEGVIAHEVLHCCYKHFSRRGYRDPALYNVAGDFVINYDLIEAGFSLPGTPISLDMIMSPEKHADVRGHMYDPQFKGMSSEAVYDKLPQPRIIQIMFGNSNDPGGCGGVMEPKGAAKSEQADQDWETAVRVAVRTAAANNAGTIPGSLRHLIGELNKPKISWRDLLRRFIDQSMTKDTSWARLSRRSVSIGALLPGTISDRLRQLVFFVDTSGSVSHAMCREMVSEAAGALDQGTADMMTIVYADTHVQHVDNYVQGDIVEAGKYSGGGTAFRNSFEWLKENAPDASCVIYLTDMETSDWGDEPDCPVMWAVFTPDYRYDQVIAEAPFGQAIHISNLSG